MMQQGGTAESQIKAVIEAWALAVREHDLTGILAHHEQDIVMFDVPQPLQSRGIEEYRKTWDLFSGITGHPHYCGQRCRLRRCHHAMRFRRIAIQADNGTAPYRWRVDHRA
jgi:ketosteroid isomerase-like protein